MCIRDRNVIDSYGFKQEGAYNLRLNGMAVCHGDSRHIQIVKKADKAGIDIHISGEAKDEQVHIDVYKRQPYRRRKQHCII